FIFFFFSSRRRHTRSKRDWSSDVCSSDLVEAAGRRGRRRRAESRARGGVMNTTRIGRQSREVDDLLLSLKGLVLVRALLEDRGRSEERRVGKECRSRGAADQLREQGSRVT